MVLIVGVLGLLGSVTGGSMNPSAATNTATSALAATRSPTSAAFPTTGTVDYQLGGSGPVARQVTIVARDSRDKPVRGRYSICYINGFQTQPADSIRRWRGVLLHDRRGRQVSDPAWPDEYVLDTSTASRRARIAKILDADIARCAASGFQAVEFDNLDSWQRSKGKLTKKNNLALAKKLVRAAHQRGLLAGQKNASEVTRQARRLGFDFAVAEDCWQWQECGIYQQYYGARVIQIEYSPAHFRQSCRAQSNSLIVLRDRNLVPRGQPGHRYQACVN